MNWKTRLVVGAFSMLAWATNAVAQQPPQAPAAEQEPPAPPQGWVVKSTAGLQLTQASFSDSWAGDEVGTVSWIATWNSEASRQLADWCTWTNSLLLQFGQTHQQDPDRDRWLAAQKSADKITYRGMLHFTVWDRLDPFVAFDVDSQFYREVEGVGTKLFTPTLFTESVGLARVLSNTAHANIVTRFGGALKETVDRFAPVDPLNLLYETRTTVDVGFEWFTKSRLAAKEDRTVFTSELRLFKNLATSEDYPSLRLHWPALDVDWQNTVTNKVNKWIAFDLFWQLLYDKQVDERGQFKQTLGVGLSYQMVGG